MLIIPIVVGIAAGTTLVFVSGFWILNPTSREMRRGYFNAFVTGLLLAAAIEVIPNALEALEIAGGRILGAFISPGVSSAPDSFWNVLVQPAQMQIMVRGLGAAAVMLIFFRANAIPVSEAGQLDEAREERQGFRRPRLMLPLEGTDYVGLVVNTLGLVSYTLWVSLTLGLLPRPSLSLILLVASSSLLGVTALGLLGNLRRRWWLVAIVSFLPGLVAGLGVVWKGERPAIELALLPLLFGALCLVYGIGRLLRLLQHEIGLGWQTTAAVAIGALLLYESRFLLSA